MSFEKINIEDFVVNPFSFFSHDWVLITVKKGDKVNTMTASWGGLGHVWKKNSITVYVRHNRYTKEFIDNADEFSVTSFDEKYRDILTYLGRTSGKNEDKISKAGLTLKFEEGIPYFEEANKVILAKKLYAEELKPGNFFDRNLVDTVYSDNDFHTLYIGEVKKILVKQKIRKDVE